MNVDISMSKSKSVVSLLLALMLVSSVPRVALADAVGVDDEPTTTAQQQTIIHSWLTGDEQPAVPEEIEPDNRGVWQLVSATEPYLDEDYEHPYQDYSQTIEAVVGAGEPYKQLFKQTLLVKDEHLTGEITLQDFKVVPGYNSNTAQIEKTHVFEEVSVQELDDIPETYKFKVKSDSAPGATTTKALKLSEVAYKVTKSDSAGAPLEYTVTAEYRGQESYLTHTYDTVYAKYAGRATDGRDRWLLDATYEYKPYPVIPGADTLKDDEVVASDDGIPWWVTPAAATAAVVVLAGAATALWLLVLRKNVKLVSNVAPLHYKDTSKGVIVLKRYLKVVDGELNLIIPDDVELFDNALNYAVVLKPTLATAKGTLNVHWRQRLVLHGSLKEISEINTSEVATMSTADINNFISESYGNR